jgi:GNAT superfamily N-acetyltransferase
MMSDLLVKLYDLPDATDLVAVLQEDGIHVRRAMAYEKHIVVRWVQDNFGPRWASECEISLSHQPSGCFLATQEGQIIGFACHDATCRNFFGPTGVSEPYRGRGVGKALLLACLNSMRAQGYAYAIIGGVGPIEFYAKAVDAVEILGSTPGIYRDWLSEDGLG